MQEVEHVCRRDLDLQQQQLEQALRCCYGRGVSFRAADTSEAAHCAQLGVWRRMGSLGRLSLAAAMSDEAAEITRLGIAYRHPSYSAQELRFAALRSRLGDPLFCRAFPAAPLLDP